MINEVNNLPIKYAKAFINSIGKQQAAVKNRQACLGFRYKFAIDKDNALLIAHKTPDDAFVWSKVTMFKLLRQIFRNATMRLNSN